MWDNFKPVYSSEFLHGLWSLALIIPVLCRNIKLEIIILYVFP